MIHPAEEYEDLVSVPRAALELPLPLPLPPGFDGEQPLSSGRQLPPDPELPGLTPPVDDLFEQVSRRPDA